MSTAAAHTIAGCSVSDGKAATLALQGAYHEWPAHAWLVVAVGLATLFGPTYSTLAATLWQSEEYAHGPIVLGITLWLLWQRRTEIARAAKPAGALAWALLIFGLILYVVGRSQEILVSEVAAQVPLLAATIALIYGWRAVRVGAFPILFLLFMIPLPAFVVVALTSELKELVSQLAEATLYSVGYPIARQGVAIHIGPYRLLVVDACSGLYSIASLAAIGVLYLYLVRRPYAWCNALILLSIIPVAIAANVSRVILLILMTYHFGADAGQGFLHGFAGVTLFLIALILLLIIDWLLKIVCRPSGRDAL